MPQILRYRQFYPGLKIYLFFLDTAEQVAVEEVEVDNNTPVPVHVDLL
jgi:hypothetical protein